MRYKTIDTDLRSQFARSTDEIARYQNENKQYKLIRVKYTRARAEQFLSDLASNVYSRSLLLRTHRVAPNIHSLAVALKRATVRCLNVFCVDI